MEPGKIVYVQCGTFSFKPSAWSVLLRSQASMHAVCFLQLAIHVQAFGENVSQLGEWNNSIGNSPGVKTMKLWARAC